MMHSASNNASRALGGALAGLLDAPARLASVLAGASTRCSSGCCEIPPPCWEPRPAGSCCLEVTPGGSATIRVNVSNCGWSRQLVTITALGKIAGWMTFSPTTLILDPIERATILVTIHAPDTVALGQQFAAPVIIRGCLNHFVRVGITIADCAGQNCCNVSVDDCQDNIHHWYDHFYCRRPCHNLRTATAAGARNG